MRGIFAAVERIGDGKRVETAHRPWFTDLPIEGWAGSICGPYFVCNVFSSMQSVLDTIAADARSVFTIPLKVAGNMLDCDESAEVPGGKRGKIIAWCAQQFGAEFGNWVATNAKSRKFVIQEIMRKASGIPDVDPLNGFRVHWE